MGISISIILLIDNRVGPPDPPFASEIVSIWDLQQDYDLMECKDTGFLAAIGGGRDGTKPLFEERGFPELGDLRSQFDDLAISEVFVSWLTYSELLRSLEHVNRMVESLGAPVQAVIETMSVLAKHFGDDRVRMVYGVSN